MSEFDNFIEQRSLKMSTELTTPIKIEIPGIGTIESADLYLKSEADKVIAEQREKYKELAKLHDKAIQACCDADKVIDHQKYKRCLAMADFCESQHDYYETLGNGFWLVRGDIETRDKYRKKASDFWWKWHKRWLELAKEFKREYENGRR